MTHEQADRALAKLALALPGGRVAWGGDNAGWCLTWDRRLTHGEQRLVEGTITLVAKDGLP